MVPGKGHSNQVQDIAATDDTLVSCGMDDMVMFTKLATVTQSGSVDLFLRSLCSNLSSDSYNDDECCILVNQMFSTLACSHCVLFMLVCAIDNSWNTAVNNFRCRYHHQIKLPSQPKGVDSVSGGLAVVACINEVVTLTITCSTAVISFCYWYLFVIELWNH